MGILQAFSQKEKKEELPVYECSGEIFVTKYKEEISYENGKKIIERKPQVVNVSKKVNATAQLLKATTADDKLKQIEELMKR